MGRQAAMFEPVVVARSATAGFQDWLAQANGALAVPTYQAAQVAMLGWDGRQISLLMREFEKPLGLSVGEDHILLATRYDSLVLVNSPLPPPDFSSRPRALSTLAEQTRQAITKSESSYWLGPSSEIVNSRPGRTGNISASRSVNIQQEFQTLVGG